MVPFWSHGSSESSDVVSISLQWVWRELYLRQLDLGVICRALAEVSNSKQQRVSRFEQAKPRCNKHAKTIVVCYITSVMSPLLHRIYSWPLLLSKLNAGLVSDQERSYKTTISWQIWAGSSRINSRGQDEQIISYNRCGTVLGTLSNLCLLKIRDILYIPKCLQHQHIHTAQLETWAFSDLWLPPPPSLSPPPPLVNFR